jgi:hypothetical protein
MQRDNDEPICEQRGRAHRGLCVTVYCTLGDLALFVTPYAVDCDRVDCCHRELNQLPGICTASQATHAVGGLQTENSRRVVYKAAHCDRNLLMCIEPTVFVVAEQALLVTSLHNNVGTPQIFVATITGSSLSSSPAFSQLLCTREITDTMVSR